MRCTFDFVIYWWNLRLQEKKLVAEIKKTAKTGNEASLSIKLSKKSIFFFFFFFIFGKYKWYFVIPFCHWNSITLSWWGFSSFIWLYDVPAYQAATRILARQLVRLRQQITNLQGSRAQIRGVATHTQVRIPNNNMHWLMFSLLQPISGFFFSL